MFLLDNYDSFTFNLVSPLRAWGAEVVVARPRANAYRVERGTDGALETPVPARTLA